MGDSERGLFTARVLSGIGEVRAVDWDACAGALNPFVCHAFLAAAEDSGSATAEAGWMPQHIVVEDMNGRVVGAMPLYLKSHSQGEYIFDHGWADAFERAGGAYYPKFLSAAPFSPVAGPRLMTRPGPQAFEARRGLIAAAVELTERAEVSSLHVNFLPEDEWRDLGDVGFLRRSDRQFHWFNDGYEDFDGFLASLTSRKRKAVKRERRAAAESGLTIEILTNNDLTTAHWNAFFECYMATADRKWGYPYLTREFFDRLGETIAHKVVLMLASHDGRVVAGAYNMLGGDALYGRNWGALGYFPFLHFELCYYRAIEFAIDHGLARVEAGAQGHHKIARGYMPVHTYSAHWIRHEGLREAVADYLDHERPAVDQEIEALATYAPFRKED